MPGPKRARIIVVGNEKGGSGKSTVSIHLIVGMLRAGLSVGSVDMDGRQGTISRYLENRQAYADRHGCDLPLPEHVRLRPPDGNGSGETDETFTQKLMDALDDLGDRHDVVLVDTPGRSDHLTRLAHAFADTLVTPINDSHIDLDLIGTVDPETRRALRPSIYSELVWEQRRERALRKLPPLEWVVMRNRIRSMDTRVAREITEILANLAQRFAFRVAPGFGERQIFQEMFPQGLTLLDLREADTGVSFTMSHVAARNEIRLLLNALGYALDTKN